MTSPALTSDFVIVRHGNTFAPGEPPRRIGARTDLPLTAAGLAQADALGQHFAMRGMRFARVLASPLARTRETAHAILARLPGAPSPEAADWLREIDHGPDEGMTVDAATRTAAWHDLFARDAGPTLLVTSNGAARFALVAAGLEVSGGMKLATGSYGVISKGPDGALNVVEWGTKP